MPNQKDKLTKVLYVDDDYDDFILVDSIAKESLKTTQIDHVFSHDDAMDALLETEYDVCLLDYRLGKKSGLDLLKTMRESGIDTPVIFLTGAGSEVLAVKTLKSGAIDYIPKSNVSPRTLSKALKEALSMKKAVNEFLYDFSL